MSQEKLVTKILEASELITKATRKPQASIIFFDEIVKCSTPEHIEFAKKYPDAICGWQQPGIEIPYFSNTETVESAAEHFKLQHTAILHRMLVVKSYYKCKNQSDFIKHLESIKCHKIQQILQVLK